MQYENTKGEYPTSLEDMGVEEKNTYVWTPNSSEPCTFQWPYKIYVESLESNITLHVGVSTIQAGIDFLNQDWVSTERGNYISITTKSNQGIHLTISMGGINNVRGSMSRMWTDEEAEAVRPFLVSEDISVGNGYFPSSDNFQWIHKTV